MRYAPVRIIYDYILFRYMEHRFMGRAFISYIARANTHYFTVESAERSAQFIGVIKTSYIWSHLIILLFNRGNLPCKPRTSFMFMCNFWIWYADTA